MTYEDFQVQVMRKVAERFKDESWFTGSVSVTALAQFYPDQFDDAVEHSANNTYYWDAFKWFP